MENIHVAIVSTETWPLNILEKAEGGGGQERRKGMVTWPEQEVIA